MSGDAIDAVDHGEDIEVECLFYAITRRSNSDYERVAVVLGPQDVRLMFIDWSAPQNPCSWPEPALPLQEPVRVECLSYVFTWPDLCLRRSKVRLPDLPNMEPLEFQDRGAFAQSMYSPGAGPWLDDYVDVFAAVCLMAEDGEPVAGRLGLVGLGAGTSARQLLQLLPERRLVAWETSKAVLMAAEYCGGISFERLEVRTEDLLDTGVEVPKGEPLAVLVLDVHVDGGD